MPASTDNIEIVARALCERVLRKAAQPGQDISYDVERFWHCIAAELEAGFIDDDGNRVGKRSIEEGADAYVDWRRRHPDYVPPPPLVGIPPR